MSRALEPQSNSIQSSHRSGVGPSIPSLEPSRGATSAAETDPADLVQGAFAAVGIDSAAGGGDPHFAIGCRSIDDDDDDDRKLNLSILVDCSSLCRSLFQN